MCFNQRGKIATLNGSSLKQVDKFTYLGSSVSSTETDINIFFQAVVVSILLYGCTAWTLTKRIERKLDGNYTRMLRAILSKSWRQHPAKQQLYGHWPPSMKSIQVRQTRYAEHCWRNRDELISDILLGTPLHRQGKAGQPARTYIQQLGDDTGCSLEDLPEAIGDRKGWREWSGRSLLARHHHPDDIMQCLRLYLMRQAACIYVVCSLSVHALCVCTHSVCECCVWVCVYVCVCVCVCIYTYVLDWYNNNRHSYWVLCFFKKILKYLQLFSDSLLSIFSLFI